MASGCSGLPKLRQLTSARGRAPRRPGWPRPRPPPARCPAAGSRAHQRWLPSEVMASARPGVDAGGRVLEPQHAGVAARAVHRVEEQLVVVLRHTHDVSDSMVEQVGARVAGSARAASAESARRADRSAGSARGGRAAGRPRAAKPRARRPAPRRRAGRGCAAAAGGHRADHRGRASPSGRRWRAPRRGAGLDDGQHALLALAGHDLEGLHARLALGHLGHVDVHAHAARVAVSLVAQVRPAPQVLDADDQAGVEHLEAGLDEPLLLERVAHLHAGALGRRRRRRRSRPMPAPTHRRCRRARWTSRTAPPGCPRPDARPEHQPLTGRTPRQNTFTSGLS